MTVHRTGSSMNAGNRYFFMSVRKNSNLFVGIVFREAGSDVLFNVSDIGNEYVVRSEEISTRRGLIRAILKMCEQPWAEKEHIRGLIEISAKFVSKKV